MTGPSLRSPANQSPPGNSARDPNRFPASNPTPDTQRISVIIPTLNEAARIERCVTLARRRAVWPPVEIIVSDCASSDTTVAIARRLNVRLVTDPAARNRATTCAAAARSAAGDVLLFLHADSDVPERYDALIREALADRRVVGGAFEFALDGPERRLRLVEAFNRIRYRLRGRYFGDQGIFVRRAAYHAAGGFGRAPILEDVRLCERLQRLGRLRLIHRKMSTSPRRFYAGGILWTLIIDGLILTVDLLGGNAGAFARWYRRDNERRGSPRSRMAQESTAGRVPARA